MADKYLAGRDYLLVRQNEADEMHNSGLHIPDMQQVKPSEGIVDSVGPLVQELKPGDRIKYNKGAGIPMGDGDIVLIREDDYLCKIVEDDTDTAQA